jgi:hypothetical protein
MSSNKTKQQACHVVSYEDPAGEPAAFSFSCYHTVAAGDGDEDDGSLGHGQPDNNLLPPHGADILTPLSLKVDSRSLRLFEDQVTDCQFPLRFHYVCLLLLG